MVTAIFMLVALYRITIVYADTSAIMHGEVDSVGMLAL